MSDFQHARLALGARLRQLRTDAGLNGKELATRLGWQRSKVSRLENGKQTASKEDLQAWVAAVGTPDAAPDLLARLRNLHLQHQSWRRQLAAGHRAVQERIQAEEKVTTFWRGYESGVIPGLFQTPDYARHVFLLSAETHRCPPDTEDAVRARMRRQDVLYEPGRQFHVLIWEAALHLLLCPREVMAGQLDRLAGMVGRDNVQLGIIPLGAPMGSTAKHGFWIRDDRLVTAETVSAELHLDSAEDIALYLRVWRRLQGAAVYGAPAHRLILRARASLDLS